MASGWMTDLHNALEAAPPVVLVGSWESFLSEYVSGEWHRALQQNKRITGASFRSASWIGSAAGRGIFAERSFLFHINTKT